jgi:DNA polymerase III delta prime subunit
MEYVPFVEKYRGKKIDDIVLDQYNKKIIKNILETSYFPNLLLWGPPGTGKTTTIINLVNAYQEKNNELSKGLMIHFNASEERSVEIIRNQINQFVNSNTLLGQGTKFIILDEIDYMTKNAQQALKQLMLGRSNSVRFCVICNYISRVDEGLQNEFIKLRFNELPKDDIISFLSNICEKENLNMDKHYLELIQKFYKSDIRSMVNFLQSNQNITFAEPSKQNPKMDNKLYIIEDSIWERWYNKFSDKDVFYDIKINKMIEIITQISYSYNIDKKNIIKIFLNYIIRNKKEIVSPAFLSFVENIMHVQDCNINYFINYSLCKLANFIQNV